MIRLPYSCLDLDRSAALRVDGDWLAAAVDQPAARAVVLWRDRCLVRADRIVSVPPSLLPGRDPVLLGRAGGDARFAIDVSDLEWSDAVALVGADAAVDVRRMVGSVDAAEASMLAYARGILHWHRQQRFCGACGAPASSANGGHQRICTYDACGRVLFPRIEPAVITLVEAPRQRGLPDRCLLGRHRGATSYSTLAGFVEIGESLEDAVRREVFEEAGVRVTDVTYQASQAWPFPAGIMLGFRARSLDDVPRPDGDELIDARWFSRPELSELLKLERASGHQPDSIESFLVDTWLRAGD
jgi:NAD+ diphosphatase